MVPCPIAETSLFPIVWKMVNFGRVEIKGVDATLSLGVPMGEKMALDVDASYTYQYAVDKTDSKKSYYRHQLPYTPRHSGKYSATGARKSGHSSV